MSILWDSSSLNKITNAHTNMKWKATGVAIDSRKVKKGDLFCAINGINKNGHNYINMAVEKGAAACLISENIINEKQIAFSKVKNVITALECMAKDIRRRSKAKFIAVTGSVGKTGTKDMIKLALEGVGKSYANESSYNNYIGVPLSLSRIPNNTKFCTLELGMNKKGEIKKLAKLVEPQVAVLTSVELSHLQGLKSLKNIADAKSEVLEILPVDGCLIINNETNYSEYIKNKASKLGIKNIITYGKRDLNDISLISYHTRGKYYHIKALCFGNKVSWKMPIIDEHWIYNSLSILAIASYFKIDIEKILKRISSFKIPQGRGNKSFLSYKKNRFTLIDDSYNSNPASLKASLNNFSSLEPKGRKFLVLGEMLELGKESLKIHRSFKGQIENSSIDILLTIGKNMRVLNKLITKIKNKTHEENLDKIFSKILRTLKDGDVILLKGSNSINLKVVVDKIIKECKKL